MNGMRRARWTGALIVVVALCGGIAIGRVLPRVQPTTQLLVQTTDRLPEELRRLKPNQQQRDALQAVLRVGSERVMRVVDQFHPLMQAAVDSTDREIRALLTPSQLAAFDSARKINGPLLRRERIGGPPLDTVPKR